MKLLCDCGKQLSFDDDTELRTLWPDEEHFHILKITCPECGHWIEVNV